MGQRLRQFDFDAIEAQWVLLVDCSDISYSLHLRIHFFHQR